MSRAKKQRKVYIIEDTVYGLVHQVFKTRAEAESQAWDGDKVIEFIEVKSEKPVRG